MENNAKLIVNTMTMKIFSPCIQDWVVLNDNAYLSFSFYVTSDSHYSFI